MKVRVVFDGPPGPPGGRFVELEDKNGHGLGPKWGQWVHTSGAPEYWALEVEVIDWRETCDDRGYECCERMPCDADLNDGGAYERWYEAHVIAYLKHLWMVQAADARREQLLIERGLR